MAHPLLFSLPVNPFGTEMDESHYALLTMAFGFGLLHALDADHIAAVSGLACGREQGGWRAVRRFSLQWATGHGLVLLLIGATVLLLGMAIPEQLSHLAESLVGVVLLLIGFFVLRDLWQRRLHFRFHHHHDLPRHAHWHELAEDLPRRSPVHSHAPLLVGMMHGTAGSAPLLALLPLASQHSPWIGMGYLLLFGLGVLFSMLLFGGVLGWLLQRLADRAARLVVVLRASVGVFALGFGGWLLHGIA